MIYKHRKWNMRDKVKVALDSIRPTLLADWDNVELADVDEDAVTLRLTGACSLLPDGNHNLAGIALNKCLRSRK